MFGRLSRSFTNVLNMSNVECIYYVLWKKTHVDYQLKLIYWFMLTQYFGIEALGLLLYNIFLIIKGFFLPWLWYQATTMTYLSNWKTCSTTIIMIMNLISRDLKGFGRHVANALVSFWGRFFMGICALEVRLQYCVHSYRLNLEGQPLRISHNTPT